MGGETGSVQKRKAVEGGGAGTAFSPGQPGVASKAPSKTIAEKARQKDRPHAAIPFVPSKCKRTHSDQKQTSGCLGCRQEQGMTKGTGNWGSDQYLACDDGFIRMWVYIYTHVGHVYMDQN